MAIKSRLPCSGKIRFKQQIVYLGGNNIYDKGVKSLMYGNWKELTELILSTLEYTQPTTSLLKMEFATYSNKVLII